MDILYGVQATGNGHISRSREVVRNLKALGHSVHVILSGRDPALLKEMDVFEPFQVYRGLTFITVRGKVSYWKTAKTLNLFRFYQDIYTYEKKPYDLVITDFEPITARIARRCGIPSIGLGHQYAFIYDIPMRGNFFTRWIIKHFAFADYPIGLHWHHFDQPILPPIIPHHLRPNRGTMNDKILVYLPFEDLVDIRSVLKPYQEYHFYCYGNVDQPYDETNLRLRPFSRSGFLKDLEECGGVITNAGFELVSEALQLGKKILVKPLAGQMEQVSNALVMETLKIGMTMSALDGDAIQEWLKISAQKYVVYPDVAKIIANWVDSRQWHDITGLAREAWSQTRTDFSN